MAVDDQIWEGWRLQPRTMVAFTLPVTCTPSNGVQPQAPMTAA